MANTSNDDDKANLKPKKEKILHPLSSNTNDSGLTGLDNEDLLAELREKTARLAKEIKGSDEPLNHTLELDDSDEYIIEALKQDRLPKQSSGSDSNEDKQSTNPAVELVRQKLAKIYKNEPAADAEAAESIEAGRSRSKHQEFMYNLTTSGKSLADIQTEWHNYYVSLPDEEKHIVWKEFYEQQSHVSHFANSNTSPEKPKEDKKTSTKMGAGLTAEKSQKTISEIKDSLYKKVSADGRLTPKQHFKSLAFGLGLAAFVGLVMTFTFFNEVFIAPFISPARTVSATPIVGNGSEKVGPESKIIIPKINLEVPVVFDMDTVVESEVQNALEDGVVHYATTPNPGEKGNSVIVGHSSNNILNAGKYKFAFVLLKRLEAEDLFFVQKDGVRYTYKVYKKEVVGPSEVSVLEKQDRDNTMTLITCDPPGTSVNRLIVVGEQISPDPGKNKASTAIEIEEQSVEELPSNAPSLWSRIWPF